jgi:PAS domain S-box-containing protein
MANFNYNELTFQSMVEASPNALLLVNQLGKIIYLNTFAEKLFQYKKQELIGKNIAILVPDEYKGENPNLLKRYFENPKSRQMGLNKELYALKKDGTEFPVEIGLSPIETKEGVVALAAVIDISARKQANKQFEMVVESAPNAIVLVKENGSISLINKQTEILFGYDRKELIGKKIEALLPDRYVKHHVAMRDSFFANPQTRPMGAGRHLFAKRKNGNEFPIEIALTPIETNEGKVTLASIIDISERLNTENILKQNLKKIDQKNKELEQFAYITSHDLQEPLNTIISFTNILQKNCNNNMTELDKKSFDFIVKAATRMKNLIKGVLDFSRLGKKSKLKEVNCNNLVSSVCLDLGTLIKKTNAQISVQKLPTIKAYETELRLLFQNLLTNAIKFMEPGKTPKISIDAKKDNLEWVFSIKDNGIGIDKKNKEKIFSIFQRLHSRDEYTGTGIGLAHCKKIVELHKGDICVDSQLGKGSTFYFTINTSI